MSLLVPVLAVPAQALEPAAAPAAAVVPAAGRARAAGAPIAVVSAHRSHGTQVATFTSWVSRFGCSSALRRSARPGHSEHQLGTTLDLTSAGRR